MCTHQPGKVDSHGIVCVLLELSRISELIPSNPGPIVELDGEDRDVGHAVLQWFGAGRAILTYTEDSGVSVYFVRS